MSRNKEKKAEIYGLLAEFDSGDELREAAWDLNLAGYTSMEAYSPFDVEGVAEAVGKSRTWLPLFVLGGGITGGALGFFMQYYANVIDYPHNIGGRPFNSWPSFIPVTFELTILLAALSAFLMFFVLNRLPRLNHPVFNIDEFERATDDRFFLCVESADPKFDSKETRKRLERCSSHPVREVPW